MNCDELADADQVDSIDKMVDGSAGVRRIADPSPMSDSKRQRKSLTRPQMQHDFAIPRNGVAGRVVCVGHHRKGHDLRHRLLEGPCELPSQFVMLRYPNGIIPAPAAGHYLIDVTAHRAEGAVSPGCT